ncbi:MAG: tetratricopeptide repeat protein [Nitrospirae bacterium]|nr:tetratricopeptide repeat protein [Nitrospirota bacterium]
MDKKVTVNQFKLIFMAALMLMLCSCTIPRIIIFDDPLTAQERINLGVAYENKGEFDLAIKEYQTASKKVAVGFLYLGNAYMRKGDIENAEYNYRNAIIEDDAMADAYNNLAWLYYEQKINLDEAEDLALKAVELKPENTNYRDTLNRIRNLNSKN